jgi:hypothetical protein
LANPEDIARQDVRGLLVLLRDGVGQPPLSAKMRLCIEGVMDVLGEQDLAKRLAAYDRLDAMLAELDGKRP